MLIMLREKKTLIIPRECLIIASHTTTVCADECIAICPSAASAIEHPSYMQATADDRSDSINTMRKHDFQSQL